MKKAIVQSVLVVLLVCGAASSVLADTHYAAQNGQTPSGTFTDWNSAASNIQDAVGQAANNDTVLIGAGHYTTTNGSVYGTSTNVVMISIAALTLSSSNGNPASVSIDGGGNKRGILLHSAGSATIPVVINGITISNCFISGANGGGIESDKTSGTQLVQNCVICDNITTWGGGGVDNTGGSAFMIISNCVVRHNQAGAGSLGGGIYGAQFVTDCLIESNSAGFGAGIGSGSTFQNCTIRYNSSSSKGGGIYNLNGARTIIVRNCLIYNNTATTGGGLCGMPGGNTYSPLVLVQNCTIVSNNAGANKGGGIGGSWTTGGSTTASNLIFQIENSIIRSNNSASALDLVLATTNGNSQYLSHTINNTCFYPTNLTSVAWVGSGNTTNDPRFVNFAGQDFHLQSPSPCINTGTNQDWMIGAKDIDGNPRKDRVSGIVDMGCYELPSRGTLFIIR